MLTRRKIFTIILAVTIWIVAGCVEKEPLDDEATPLSEVDPSVTRKVSAYFPAIPGMVYTYLGEGNEYASFTREVKYVEKPYLQLEDDNGGTIIATVYKIEDDQVVRVYSEGEAYTNTNLISEAAKKQGTDEVILKAPIKEGTSWESGEWKREIIGVDQTLTVPAGTFFRVIKVHVTAQKPDGRGEMTEYYAENVGLIARDFTSEDFEVTSRLKSFGVKMAEVAPPEQGKNLEMPKNVSITNPDISLMAYQMEHQLRSTFQSAYESYINLDKITSYDKQQFEQILQVYRFHLQAVAVDSLIEEHVQRLRQYYEAGEGEVTFPTHEVVQQVKLLDQTSEKAKVSISLHKYYPAREWSGKAYDQVVDTIVTLTRSAGEWKVEKVGVAE